MAVVIRYMCTRDGKMFEDKKKAIAHDKMLEAVEALRVLIEASDVGIDEEMAEKLALFLVTNKDKTLKALKGMTLEGDADKK